MKSPTVMRRVAAPIAPVHENTCGGEVYDRFHAEPSTLAIAVVDARGRPVGLVERNTFFLRMAAQFGRALYAGRPIAVLMDSRPMVVEADTPVAGFVNRALQSSGAELMRGFIIVEHGRYVGVGTVLGLLAAANDAAEAANRAKTEFLANMSHEIRTPLNGVIGVASSLSRTPLSDKQREMVSLIEGSADTLQVLLSDILDLARIEAGRLEIAPEPLVLGEMVRQIGELFRAKAEDKGLTFELDCGEAERLCVEGDPTRLKQILGNLISNAVKFTETGRVRLALASTRAADRVKLRFEVADTGIGFDEATHQRLFGRFQQADGSVGRRFGGAGLGLAISRSLAEAMGGVLEAVSTPGEGSTFSLDLTLPLAAAPEAPLTPAEPAACQGALRLLLADDHPVNRKVVELMLEGADVELASATDGVAALELFRLGRFDVVLMDMQMPNMDGLEATRAIRAHERATRAPRTPVIMLSANALPEHIAAGRAAGADRYVTKPIVAAELFAAIDQALAAAAGGEDLDAA
jgi:signal transduction histidine kinase/AmiR/NasT family two-component response regulator